VGHIRDNELFPSLPSASWIPPSSRGIQESQAGNNISSFGNNSCVALIAYKRVFIDFMKNPATEPCINSAVGLLIKYSINKL